MSVSRILFQDALRTQLTSLRTWVLLLLLPTLMFGAARLLPPEEVSVPVQVGVVLPEEGGGAFWRLLKERSGLVVEFHTAGLDQAERRVAAGRWDCALVLPEDFQVRLDRQELEGLFTLLTGPGSAVYPLVRETASSCVAQLVSPGMAADYLLDSGILTETELEGAHPRLEEVLLDQDRVLVSLETADGGPLDPIQLADRGVDTLLSGLVAILLLIWTLFAAMDLGRWLNSSFARRLVPLRGRLSLLLPRLEAALLPAFCAGALALLALDRPLARILALLPYLLFWAAAALVLAQRSALWGALPVLMPFVPVLGLLLSPMLLNVSTLFPVLAPVIRWNPVTLYLHTCGGAWMDGLILLAGGAILLGYAHNNRRSSV